MQRTPFISKKYDALGRRIRKDFYDSGSLDSTIWYYYNDNWQALCEYEGTTCREFVYGNYIDEVLLMVATVDSTSTEYYYAHDHLYSPVALMEDDGTVVERYEYDAYGKCTAYTDDGADDTWFTGDDTVGTSSAVGNPYLFTGRQVDSLDWDSTAEEYGLTLQYNRNRYYDYDTGRWLNHDPLEYIGGMNLYEYCQSNPLGATDPSGLMTTLDHQICLLAAQGYTAKEIAAMLGGFVTIAYVATVTQECADPPRIDLPRPRCQPKPKPTPKPPKGPKPIPIPFVPPKCVVEPEPKPQ